MRALPFRYTHTHVEISSTMWASLICAHPLTPTHVCAHAHTHTQWVGQAACPAASHTYMYAWASYTHIHTSARTRTGRYILHMCSDSGVHAWTETHTHIHTQLRAQRQMCHTHRRVTRAGEWVRRAHPEQAVHTKWGVRKQNTHTVVSHTDICTSVTHMRVSHTHTQCISHIHRGVTQTRVSHTQRCLTQVQFTRILQSDTHMGQVVHSAGCCRDTRTWGCVTQTWMFHTCWGVSHDVFQAKWISHTWVRVTNTHSVSDIQRCLTLTQTRVSPNAQTVSQTHRVIHAVLQAHTVSHTPSLTDTQVLHTHTRVSDTQRLTCLGHT